jgi:hypothetical protein
LRMNKMFVIAKVIMVQSGVSRFIRLITTLLRYSLSIFFQTPID